MSDVLVKGRPKRPVVQQKDQSLRSQGAEKVIELRSECEYPRRQSGEG